MHCKTSNRTQHTGGHPRLAAGQAPHGHHHQPPATRADAARAAPFAAQWPYRSFLELGALAGAVPCARLHARLVLLEWGLAALSEVVPFAYYGLAGYLWVLFAWDFLGGWLPDTEVDRGFA